MKHIATYSLFESKENPWDLPDNPFRVALGKELHHAVYDTQEGKDLLAVASFRFRTRDESTGVFTSLVVALDDFRFVIVEPQRRSPEGPLIWSFGIYPYDNPGPPYIPGGDFPTIEKCLRALWIRIVTMLCDEIFLDAYERQRNVDLIGDNLEILAGHEYSLADLRFLIPHLKRIATGDISGMDHATAARLREKYPLVWKVILDKNDPDSLGTFADLGDLGF